MHINNLKKSKYFENFVVCRKYLYKHLEKIAYIYGYYFIYYIKNKNEFYQKFVFRKILVFP